MGWKHGLRECFKSGSVKGVFWERGPKDSFQNNSFSRDDREFRCFRDSKDSSGEKTPFVMTPFSSPEDDHAMRCMTG